VLYDVRPQGIPPVDDPARVSPEVKDLLASFQRAGSRRSFGGSSVAREGRPRSPLLTGGVTANSLLRQEARGWLRPSGPHHGPHLELTTDSAAMIAAAGSVAFQKGVRAEPDRSRGQPEARLSEIEAQPSHSEPPDRGARQACYSPRKGGVLVPLRVGLAPGAIAGFVSRAEAASLVFQLA
jgi:hypothetical protein